MIGNGITQAQRCSPICLPIGGVDQSATGPSNERAHQEDKEETPLQVQLSV